MTRTQVEFESDDSGSNTVFPVSAIPRHNISPEFSKTWKPVIAYNKIAFKFMIAWRETPTTDPDNDTKVNHIRATAVSSSSQPFPANTVLSAIAGNEDPQKPALAVSSKDARAFVIWEDQRNFSTTDTDLYGNLFDTPPAKSLMITSPNGGEEWGAGTQQQITYESVGIGDFDITIEYSSDNGGNYQFVTFFTNVDGANVFNWEVPNDPSNQCLVKISVSGLSDISDALFTITAQASPITVVTPNGGEAWSIGSQEEIRWTSTNFTDPVRIDFVSISSGFYTNIVANTPNDGSFIWTLEASNFLSPAPLQGKIRVADATKNAPDDIIEDGKVFDWSDMDFTINPAQNTSTGNNISVNLGDGTDITFDNVTGEGNTTLEVTQAGTPPPNGFLIFPLGSPHYYNIETTSTFTGNIEICIKYDDTSLTPNEESILRLYVFETPPGQWKDITTSHNVANNIICGEVNHLTEFALVMSDPQIYLVTNTNDSGEGSFRNAIDLANGNASADTIRFKIPKSDPNYDAQKGVWIIKPESFYPSMLDSNTVIDGPSQRLFIAADTNPEGPEIVFDGSSMATNNGCLSILGNNIEIYELTINNFASMGISFNQTNNCIVSGCYIGTDHSGMKSEGNRDGITLSNRVTKTHIGPSSFLAKPNVISGNTQDGIFIVDSSQNNTIVGNFIGVNKNATDTIQNKLRGIDLTRGADHNTITNNIVGGNYQGIFVFESNNNLIKNNSVGTNEGWEIKLSNSDGILVFSNSSGNIISENRVGYNSGWGIKISGNNSIENKISRNSISKNLGFGIDNEDGGNMELSPPVILSIVNNQITGTAGANQLIEIFADSSNEGKVYLDSTVADANGNFSLLLNSLTDLPNITATARDNSGNTSEFSSPFIVTGIEDGESQLPTTYSLYQNYPNPFNPSTSIRYSIPERSFVKIRIYDILGNELVALVNEIKTPGIYEVVFKASDLPSGIYFCRIQTAGPGTPSTGFGRGYVETRKMILLK